MAETTRECPVGDWRPYMTCPVCKGRGMSCDHPPEFKAIYGCKCPTRNGTGRVPRRTDETVDEILREDGL